MQLTFRATLRLQPMLAGIHSKCQCYRSQNG